MLTLKYRINYRNVTLTPETGDFVGAYLKDGRITYVTWLGFINIRTAKWLGPNAKPVKLAIESYTGSMGFNTEQKTELKNNEFIQGCLVGGGAFAVVKNGFPKVISTPYHPVKTDL